MHTVGYFTGTVYNHTVGPLIYPTAWLFNIHVYRSIYLSMFLSISLVIYLSIYLHIYLSLYL